MITLQKNRVQYKRQLLAVNDWHLSFEVDGTLLDIETGQAECQRNGQTVTVSVNFPQQALLWKLNFIHTENSLLIHSKITNLGDHPVKLGKIYLLNTEQMIFGNKQDTTVILPWSIWGEAHVRRMDDPNLPELSKIKIQFYNQTQQQALQVGFMSFQRANTEISCQYSRTQGGYSIKAYCDFSGWELFPGQETATEELRIIVGDDPLEQLGNWADEVAKRVKPTIPNEAPLGYLGWSWVDCINGNESYEKVILGNIDAINERLGGFGINYLWTSMNNIEGSLPGNWLKWNKRCIPSGQKEFFRKLTDKGFIPGLWIGPFYFCSMLEELMEELQETILKNIDGTPMVVCQEWRHGDAGLLPKQDRPCLYALDPSHPKVLNFMRNVFKTYKEWGVGYYMVDFLEAGAGNIHRFPYKEHYDKSMVAGPEVYINFLREIKKAAGAKAYFLSATGPSLHHAGILDAVRTGNDFGEGRAMSSESFFYPATYVINQLDFWTGPAYALNNQAANFHTHRKLYLNDSGNVLTVDQPIPLSHAQIHATIHAFSGSQTMLGDDIRQISDQRLALIKKTLPRSIEAGRPIDLFDSPAPAMPRMFHRKIHTVWGGYDVLALYNMQDSPTIIPIKLKKLGLDITKNYLVWDFWNEAFIGKVASELDIQLSRESVRVLRFVEDSSQPVLLGSDMHLMMGEMEVVFCDYNIENMTLKVAACRPLGEQGTLFVYAPDNLYVKNFDGLHIAKDGRDNSLIISIPMVFDKNDKFSREINFAPLSKILKMKQEDLV